MSYSADSNITLCYNNDKAFIYRLIRIETDVDDWHAIDLEIDACYLNSDTKYIGLTSNPIKRASYHRTHKGKDLVMQISGGQRQAVAIARTRLTNPKLVLMDEPTAAISVRQVAEVLDLIKRLKDQGIAVLLISHRMPDIFEVCEKLVVLRRGEKVCEKMIKDSSTEEATGLITGAIDRV